MILAYQLGRKREANQGSNSLFETGISHVVAQVVDAVDEKLLRLFLPILDQACLVGFPCLVVRREDGMFQDLDERGHQCNYSRDTACPIKANKTCRDKSRIKAIGR